MRLELREDAVLYTVLTAHFQFHILLCSSCTSSYKLIWCRSGQLVHRVSAILGVMGSHDGTNRLHEASYLGVSTTLYRCIFWVDRDDIVLCHRSKCFAHPPHSKPVLHLHRMEKWTSNVRLSQHLENGPTDWWCT